MLIQPFKQQIHAHCIRLIAEKIKALQHQLSELREMIAAETKSTAGDKYETARAMIHIEQEQINRQLAEALSQQSALAQIDLSIHSERVVRGSLVDTDQGLFFIGTGIGKLIIDGQIIYALSPQAPLGAKLSGLSAGESAAVNGKVYTVKTIA